MIICLPYAPVCECNWKMAVGYCKLYQLVASEIGIFVIADAQYIVIDLNDCILFYSNHKRKPKTICK